MDKERGRLNEIFRREGAARKGRVEWGQARNSWKCDSICLTISEVKMFINGSVAEAAEKIENEIAALQELKYSIESILGRIRKKHLKNEFTKPDDYFAELDKVFDSLEPIEREGLYDYLRNVY